MQKQNKHILNHFSIWLLAVKGQPIYFIREYFRGFRHGSKMNCRLVPVNGCTVTYILVHQRGTNPEHSDSQFEV